MRRYDSTAFGPDFEAWRDARHRRKSRLRALRHRFLAQIIDLRRPNWRNHYQRAEAYLGALIAVFRECGDEREAATCARRSSCRLHPRPRRWSSIHISANFFLHLRYVGKINGLNQVDKKKLGTGVALPSCARRAKFRAVLLWSYRFLAERAPSTAARFLTLGNGKPLCSADLTETRPRTARRRPSGCP